MLKVMTIVGSPLEIIKQSKKKANPDNYIPYLLFIPDKTLFTR